MFHWWNELKSLGYAIRYLLIKNIVWNALFTKKSHQLHNFHYTNQLWWNIYRYTLVCPPLTLYLAWQVIKYENLKLRPQCMWSWRTCTKATLDIGTSKNYCYLFHYKFGFKFLIFLIFLLSLNQSPKCKFLTFEIPLIVWFCAWKMKWKFVDQTIKRHRQKSINLG